MKKLKLNENNEIVEYEVEEVQKTKEEKIADLKQKLSDTDYQAIKYAEGCFSNEEYEPIKIQRQAWRAEINDLEDLKNES